MNTSGERTVHASDACTAVESPLISAWLNKTVNVAPFRNAPSMKNNAAGAARERISARKYDSREYFLDSTRQKKRSQARTMVAR